MLLGRFGLGRDNLSALCVNLDFDNTFARLHPSFYEVVEPTPLSAPHLVAFNRDAAALIDLDPAAVEDPEAARYLSGGLRLPGAEPVKASPCVLPSGQNVRPVCLSAPLI